MQNTHDLLVGTLSIGIPSLFLIIFIHLTCKNIFVLMLGIFDEKDYRRLSLLQTSNCCYVALRYSLECLKNALRRNSLLAFAALKQQIKTMIACE